MVEFVMRNRAGEQRVLDYDPARHWLSANGISLLAPERHQLPRNDKPGMEVRLILGKKCNFKCTYCCQHQAGKQHEPDASHLEELVDHIVRIAGDAGFCSVQFWGGEPFLYFDVLKKLHRLFLERNRARETPDFFVPTNGLLLHGERADWILENGIGMMVSWDGPGQHLRGLDVLAQGRTLEAVRRIHARQPEKIAISPILSRQAKSHKVIIDMLREKLGTDKFQLGEGRIISAVDEASMSAAIPIEELPDFSRQMHADLVAGELPQFQLANIRAVGWINTLNRKNASPRPCMCHVDLEDTLIVDLEGNVLTCSTFECGDVDESGEKHKLCHISEMNTMADRPHPSLIRLTNRIDTTCQQCDVLHACRGGSPYAPDAYADYNCQASYAWNLPIVGLALHRLTGDILEEVRSASGYAACA